MIWIGVLLGAALVLLVGTEIRRQRNAVLEEPSIVQEWKALMAAPIHVDGVETALRPPRAFVETKPKRKRKRKRKRPLKPVVELVPFKRQVGG